MQSLERRLQEKRSEFDRLRQRLDLADDTDAATDQIRSELFGDGGLKKRFDDLELRKKVDAEMAVLQGNSSSTPEKKESTDAS